MTVHHGRCQRPFTTYRRRTARPTIHRAPPLFNHDKSIRKYRVLPLNCPLTSYRQTIMTDSLCWIIHDVRVLIRGIPGLIRLSVDPWWIAECWLKDYASPDINRLIAHILSRGSLPVYDISNSLLLNMLPARSLTIIRKITSA